MIWFEKFDWSVWVHFDSWYSTLNNVSAWISDEWCYIANCSDLYVEDSRLWVTWTLTTYDIILSYQQNRSKVNKRFTRRQSLRKKNKKKNRFLCWNRFIAHFRSVYDSFSHLFSKIYNISHSWKMIVFNEF